MKKYNEFKISLYRDSTLDLVNRFNDIQKREWNLEHFFLELNVQIGHVYYVLLKAEKQKKLCKEKFRNLWSIQDEIADVLMSLISIDFFLNTKCEKKCKNIVHEMSALEVVMHISILSSQMCDSFMRMQQYKQSLGRTDTQEQEFIADRLGLLFGYCEFIANFFGFEINTVYKKMLEDANSYINGIENTYSGRYCTCIRRNDRIYKHVSSKTIQNESLEAYGNKIQNYIGDLRKNGWKVADTIVYQRDGGLCVEQEFVKGMRLDFFLNLRAKMLAVDSSKNEILTLYDKLSDNIIEMYIRNPSIRIDSNICNFIVNEKKDLILIDVIPVIYLNVGKEDIIENKYLYRLKVDVLFQLFALTYYFLKNILQAINEEDIEIAKKIVKDIMDKLGRVMGKINSQKDLRDTLKNNRENWPFGEKIAILYDFANDDTSKKANLDKVFEWSFTNLINGESAEK